MTFSDLITLDEAIRYVYHKYAVLKEKRTIHKWTAIGVAARIGGPKIRLKYRRISGRRYTRKQWIDEFVKKLDESGEEK